MKQEIIQDFKDIVNSSFGDFVRYSFLTGSINYIDFPEMKGNSDVDIMVVLADEILKSRELRPRRKRFNQLYDELHRDYNLIPDDVFPGEVISSSMLEEVKSGKGFDHDSTQFFYKQISGDDNEWIENPSLEYRCWRSMYFFTRDDSFIVGDYDSFIQDRVEVIIPLIYYLMGQEFDDLPSSFPSLEKRIAQNVRRSSKNDFGYQSSYEEKLFNSLTSSIEGVPIRDAVEYLGVKDRQSDLLDREILEKRRNSFLNSLKHTRFTQNSNPFIIKNE